MMTFEEACDALDTMVLDWYYLYPDGELHLDSPIDLAQAKEIVRILSEMEVSDDSR